LRRISVFPHAQNAEVDFFSSPSVFTRRLSSRAAVRTMRQDAHGRLHENACLAASPVSAVAPIAPWMTNLTGDTGAFRLLYFDHLGDGQDLKLTFERLVRRANLATHRRPNVSVNGIAG
jgi:hypothetical protein